MRVETRGLPDKARVSWLKTFQRKRRHVFSDLWPLRDCPGPGTFLQSPHPPLLPPLRARLQKAHRKATDAALVATTHSACLFPRSHG